MIDFIKRNSIIFIAVIISILLVTGFFSYILSDSNAKYVNNNKWNHYFESNGFFFSSNKLRENSKKTIINFYNGEDISFEVYNYINNNITDSDINYRINCNTNNENYKCYLDNTENNALETTILSVKKCFNGNEELGMDEVTCNANNYEYKSVTNKKNHIFKVEKTKGETPSNLNITLTVTTTSPFEVVLTGNFVLNIDENYEANKISVSLKDSDETTCKYEIKNTYTVDKVIKLTINTSKLLFDNTSPFYNNKLSYTTTGEGYVNSINMNLKPTSISVINLYKKDYSNTCNIDDVTQKIVTN